MKAALVIVLLLSSSAFSKKVKPDPKLVASCKGVKDPNQIVLDGLYGSLKKVKALQGSKTPLTGPNALKGVDLMVSNLEPNLASSYLKGIQKAKASDIGIAMKLARKGMPAKKMKPYDDAVTTYEKCKKAGLI